MRNVDCLAEREAPSPHQTREQPMAASVRVICLGPLGTYSHQAVRKFVNEECVEIVTASSICAAAEIAARATTLRPTLLVLPIENSARGIVLETLACFSTPTLFGPSVLRVMDEVDLTVSHALLAATKPTGALSHITEVHSHPQVRELAL